MRNVLITGASRGIGRACAYEFASLGDRVLLNYNRSFDEAEKTADETGGFLFKADISKSAEVDRMYRSIKDKFGGVDVIVNNAGIAQSRLFTDITEDDWDRMFDVNIKGMYLVTRRFIKDMINKKRGRIVNISSMWGVAGGSMEVHYSASKAAVIGFTKALAKEAGLSGISVNCVAPGIIDTDMNKSFTGEELRAAAEETALARIGAPEEIARTVSFLASEAAGYITGQVICADGGYCI